MGVALRGLVRQLEAICEALTELESLIDAAFLAHPDGRIIRSVPGLGVALGARLLGEIGHDHTRFADGRALKAFAGAAPVTRASGRSTFVQPGRA
ncbi:MAG: Transposase family protein [Pseudonocardia sp.]|jgi:transposase|nr:Transposase family protein [Pseudonocardia sp.]